MQQEFPRANFDVLNSAKWNEDSEESNFPIAVTIEEHEEFIAAFNQVFRVKEEKTDFFVKGDFVYYLERV